ncbi:unnamed protein product, partial [Tilletia laevis]
AEQQLYYQMHASEPHSRQISDANRPILPLVSIPSLISLCSSTSPFYQSALPLHGSGRCAPVARIVILPVRSPSQSATVYGGRFKTRGLGGYLLEGGGVSVD